jgi:hypothetical protein
MIVGTRFAYALYDSGRNREQLYDLERDPGQTRNYAAEAGMEATLQEFRTQYQAQYHLPTPEEEPRAER